jgi:hypothetical protein
MPGVKMYEYSGKWNVGAAIGQSDKGNQLVRVGTLYS